MDISNINWLAVFVSSISSFTVGAIWFGPKTFYPMWIRSMGRELPTERVKMTGGETAVMFGGTYVAALVQVATLAVIIELARAAGIAVDWGIGAIIGFTFTLGLGAFGSVSHRMFGSADFKVYRSLKVWILEVGQDVVSLTIAGIIIGAWL